MRHAATREPVEVPKRLRKRPKDKRGYPIPFIVLRDKNKKPHFTINDQEKVHEVIRKKLCGLCGDRLDNGAWFVGGAVCFTHPLGAFVDPPMHEDCAKYALQVCPFLAAPSYAKRIDDRTLRPEDSPEDRIIASVEMKAEQPELFGLGQCAGYQTVPNGPGQFAMRPIPAPGSKSNWLRLEFWNDGARLDDAAAIAKLAELGLIDPQPAQG